MPRFSSQTIARVRRNASAMLTDTCTLYRQTAATGTMGEPLDALELLTSGVRCRVIRAKTPNANTQAVIGSQKSEVEAYRLECPYDTTLVVDMVVKLSNGNVYQITSIEDQLTDSAFAVAVITRVRL